MKSSCSGEALLRMKKENKQPANHADTNCSPVDCGYLELARRTAFQHIVRTLTTVAKLMAADECHMSCHNSNSGWKRDCWGSLKDCQDQLRLPAFRGKRPLTLEESDVTSRARKDAPMHDRLRRDDISAKRMTQ